MATSESYPQQAQKKLYPGHYECLFHTMLAEMFKDPVDTLCRKCFTHIGHNQVRITGMLLVRCELLWRRTQALEKLVDKLLEEDN